MLRSAKQVAQRLKRCAVRSSVQSIHGNAQRLRREHMFIRCGPCCRTWQTVKQLLAQVVNVDAVVLQSLAEVVLPHADAAAALHACWRVGHWSAMMHAVCNRERVEHSRTGSAVLPIMCHLPDVATDASWYDIRIPSSMRWPPTDKQQAGSRNNRWHHQGSSAI